jgi:hypothetical protein
VFASKKLITGLLRIWPIIIVDSMEFETIKIASTVAISMVINVEDFDTKVELWKGAVDGPYIYVEDLV